MKISVCVSYISALKALMAVLAGKSGVTPFGKVR